MPFQSSFEEFIYTRTYSRFIDADGRRERWPETVSRFREFFLPRVPVAKRAEFAEVCSSIQALEVLPSMRSLWAAGPALERENVCGYNCAYMAIDSIMSFPEALYLLLCGAGVGFSVERQYINKLPEVPSEFEEVAHIIEVADSKEGWSKAFRALLSHLYEGKIPSWDMSKVRPAGARLKTFGGRASGPGPLEDLFKFTVSMFEESRGRKLNSVECHRILCKAAESVVVGGVRRSACISFSNPSDDRMRNLKTGAFWEVMPELAMANNSAVYTEKPEAQRFFEDWLALVRSKSGERGIFNRESAKYIVGLNGRRNVNYEWGSNPCCEVILRSRQFCNLSEVVVREGDTLETLRRKVRNAAILGVVQSTLTKFSFISREWKKNCEEERLCGVSLTGLRDHEVLSRTSNDSKLMLTAMKQVALDTAEEYSKALGINMPAAVTLVKPSGTVSSLVNSAAGLHPRYAPYYIRRVRVSATDPIARYLKDRGVPYHPEVGQSAEDPSTLVFEFPVRAPKSAVFRDEVTAIEQLEYWLMLQKYWCECKPSATVYVKDDEWPRVAAWVYDHWNWVSGIAFLPYDGGVYKLMPYEEITQAVYKDLSAKMPDLDFSGLSAYEEADSTIGAREFACVGGSCDLL